jgi:glycyl-tRNA synthetase beta chain
MTTKNLLVELFVEELPPKVLKKLGYQFAIGLNAVLANLHLTPLENDIEWFASPRRLAVLIKGILAEAPVMEHATKLMPISVGLDADGQATPALLRKLSNLGLDTTVVPHLWPAPDKNLYYKRDEKGATLAEGLQKALEETLAKLPIPKVMTYQLANGWDSVQFVRPAHRLVALHGAEVVPISVLGLQAGRTTQGHRFEASSATLEIRDADSYEAQMENEGAVIPSFEKRRAEIKRQLAEAAAKVGGGVKPIEDDALLDEVTGLVERPNVLLCQFEAQFLEVPQECLILTMKANQKYFPLLDDNGKLTNKFLVVSNIRPDDASAVIGGNERVVRPRLADAKFFFDQDRKKPLDSRVLGLAKVVYHNKLGTQGERVGRVQAIARAIAQQLGGDALASQADQAALLAKADLLTDMVGEFPELQGIMGRYYAQHDGLSDDIAYAIEDHYKPRFSGDKLPRNMVGLCVALADKLETLVGMFGIGQIPTGDKDPFALRRHALGIIGCIGALDLATAFGASFSLNLTDWLNIAIQSFKGYQLNSNTASLVEDFIFERQWNLLAPMYGLENVGSVIVIRPPINQVVARVLAVRVFAALPEAAALAAANKRVGNILKKAEGDSALRQAQGERLEINVALLQEPAEQALHLALSQITPNADAAFSAGDYSASLQTLAALREPVDAFFDNVMVNAEDEKLRANRLALLSQLHQAMNRVADISKLAA